MNSTRVPLLHVLCVVVVTTSFALLASGQASPTGIHIAVRDSSTGFAVAGASVKWSRVGTSVPTVLPYLANPDKNGLLSLESTQGEYALEISAPGYKVMRTHAALAAGKQYPFNIFLDPLVSPPELDEETTSGDLKDGFELVHGYAVDSRTHTPISGANIQLQESGATTTTNSRGYFVLYAPAGSLAEANGPEDVRSSDTLFATAKGYQSYQLSSLLHVAGGEAVIRIDLVAGTGNIKERTEHGALLTSSRQQPAKGTPVSKAVRDWLASPRTGNRTGIVNTGAVVALANITLPASIRVGSNCGTVQHGFGCTTVNTYSLETYVQDGLDKEWIANWNSESLKAGSVAYRSYGSYFAQNPICPTANGSSCPVAYDICNTTWCQVFSTSSQKATVAAAKATAGVALTADGVNAFFSEYAANTNNFLPCVDGQAGMPNYSPPVGSAGGPWPCMADPIALGSSGSGHGRGMSQWGSQYWARGMSYGGVPTSPRKWQCIVDHYYNDNGGTSGAKSLQRISLISGPGGDGPIAFPVSGTNTDIYSMAIDGSSLTRLTNDRVLNGAPSWSPGGSKMVFPSLRNTEGIWTMNSDGSGETQIKGISVGVLGEPSWSTLGDKIAFVLDWEAQPNCPNRGYCLSIMNADGSNEVDFNLPAYEASKIAWSPDQTKIVYTSRNDLGLHVVNADGTGDQVLYYDPTLGPGAFNPSWSPDGTKIAFDKSETTGLATNGIYLINADGTGLLRITAPASSNICDCYPSWSADGSTIVFASNRNGSNQLFSVNVNSFGVDPINNNVTTSNPDCRRCGRFDRL